MDLTGKNILISGGAKGLGRNLVRRLSAEQVTIGVFDIDEEGLAVVAREHPSVYCAVCDVRDSVMVKAAIDAFTERHNTIDVLVNNAGYVFNSPLISLGKGGWAKHSVEMWDKVIQTDLSSVFYMTVHAVEKMLLNRTKGVVISISSIAAAGNAGQGAYSAAKAGINALTVAWAKELGPMKIRFVGIAPGFISTDTTIESIDEKVLNNWLRQTPVGRIGSPHEITDAIVFAIRNDFVNGKILEIDGGLRI